MRGRVGDVERLYAWDVGAGELAAMRERLRRRPEYPAAARRLAVNMLADADGDVALGGLLRDAGRTVAALSAVYLNASGGLTLARLKGFLAGFGLVSPGRARGLMNLMLHLRYVTQEPGRRPRRYGLTPSFLASYARHEASLLDAVAVVEPAARRLADGLDAPGVLDRLVTEQGAAFVAGSGHARGFEAWYGIFMHRLAGIQLLHGLVAQADSFPPSGPIAFSAVEMARRFDVSRVHVSRMIHEAAAAGFVTTEPGALRFTEEGQRALDWLYASRLCVHLACAARTLKGLEPGAVPLAPLADARPNAG